ncbi:MAG: FAD/NAD(P)-binding protein [Spirochaetales bacterium]|nr:FAD/NAD(P)-binding protein [Spirochaetales bacterium]
MIQTMHNNIENKKSIYLPEVATLVKKKKLTDLDTYFEFELKDRPLGHLYGQFVEVSVPGIGEAPISISSPPTATNRFEMVIRKIGQVTTAIHSLEPGDAVGIRGPFGSSFPMESLKGKNLLFVAGGIGLVPARSAILYALQNRNDYKDITILFGSRDPSQRLFTDELQEWKSRKDVTFLESVDKCDPGTWDGNVGVITTLFPLLKNVNPLETYAIVVGPPVMYKFVIMTLYDMEFSDKHIIVSLERHMKCGVGKCGHCQINNLYVCQDGPVFTYDDIKHLKEAI